MNDHALKAQQGFINRFQRCPVLINSPGRINLIGEHVDYNEGLVMPAAVDCSLVLAVDANKDQFFRIHSLDMKQDIQFSREDIKPGHEWFHYLMGVVDEFFQKGLSPTGVDAVVSSNIPAGAGLSSSAALCCGFAYALNELNGYGLPKSELARIAQRAEHIFAGVQCGRMDQYACLFGLPNNVLLLDCRSFEVNYLPFQFDDVECLLINTGVKHTLASSGYNERRNECEEGVAVLKKKFSEIVSLRDVTGSQLNAVRDKMSDKLYMRTRYVVEEIARVKKAVEFIGAGKVKAFSKLLFETHYGLRDQFQVSCEELDFLVDTASETSGVFGARMMGGGFGGCTLNLIRKDAVEEVIESVKRNYLLRFNVIPKFINVKTGNGVSIILDI